MSNSAEDERATSPVPLPSSTNPAPLSKSRTIMRMLTTKLSTPRQPNTPRIARPPPVVNAYSKEHREAALRARGLLPPLPMSQQEAMQDQSIPIVSPGHTRDSSQPSAADLIKKEWETKNKQPLDVERERMNGFKFGSSTIEDPESRPGSQQDHRRGSSSDIRPYNLPLPPSPSPYPPSSYSRSASPVANPKRRNTTAATTSSSSTSSPAASRSPSPPAVPSPPSYIPSRPLPETFNHSHALSGSSLPAAASPAKPTSVSPAPTPSHTPIPDPHISPANPIPNGDSTPAISFTPPSIPLPPTPPTRRSTVGTPSASRAPSRAASRAASPLPNDNTAPGTPPSRSRAGSTSASAGPRRGNTTLDHKRNEESFSSLMEKSIEAVFAGMTAPRSRSGSRTAADAAAVKNASRSASPTPVPTPRPNQSPTHDQTFTTTVSPIPTSSFLQAHKRTPTNTTSLSDTLSTSPPPSLFSHNNKPSPTTGELSASGSSSASEALTSDTSAESSPTLPSKPASGILDRVLSGTVDDPLDAPPPVPIKNLKLGGSLMPKGKLGGLSVKTKEAAQAGAPDVVLSPGPVGGAFVMLTPGGGSEVDVNSPRRMSDEGSEGPRDVTSDDGILSGFDDYDDDEGMDDVKSQSAHTDGHLGVKNAKGKKAPRRTVTDPGSPAVGSKFASSVSASGHGGNVRNTAGGAPPVAKSGWMSQVKRSVVGTLVRRGGDKEKKEDTAGAEKRGRPTKGFNASHLPPSPPPVSVPENIPPSPTPVPHTNTRSKTLSPSSPPPAPSAFWSRAPQRTNTRSQTLSPPTSPRGFSNYSSGNSSTNAMPASPRKAVSPVLYNAGDISKQASAIEDEETRRMTELAFMG